MVRNPQRKEEARKRAYQLMISSSSQKLRDYERKLLLPRNEDGHKVTQEVIRGDQEDKRKNDRQFAKEVVQESFELQEE